MVLGCGRLVVAVVLLRLGTPQPVSVSTSMIGPFGRSRSSASGQALGDLLEQPAVAVWIAERGMRHVGATWRVLSGQAERLVGLSAQLGIEGTVVQGVGHRR